MIENETIICTVEMNEHIGRIHVQLNYTIFEYIILWVAIEERCCLVTENELNTADENFQDENQMSKPKFKMGRL